MPLLTGSPKTQQVDEARSQARVLPEGQDGNAKSAFLHQDDGEKRADFADSQSSPAKSYTLPRRSGAGCTW